MTIDILNYARDGGKVISTEGNICICQCGCGETFRKLRRLVLRKGTKLRCSRCYQDQMSEKALEEKRRLRESA